LNRIQKLSATSQVVPWRMLREKETYCVRVDGTVAALDNEVSVFGTIHRLF